MKDHSIKVVLKDLSNRQIPLKLIFTTFNFSIFSYFLQCEYSKNINENRNGSFILITVGSNFVDNNSKILGCNAHIPIIELLSLAN